MIGWSDPLGKWKFQWLARIRTQHNQCSPVSVVKRQKSHDFNRVNKSKTWDGFSLSHSYLIEDLSSILCSQQFRGFLQHCKPFTLHPFLQILPILFLQGGEEQRNCTESTQQGTDVQYRTQHCSQMELNVTMPLFQLCVFLRIHYTIIQYGKQECNMLQILFIANSGCCFRIVLHFYL